MFSSSFKVDMVSGLPLSLRDPKLIYGYDGSAISNVCYF